MTMTIEIGVCDMFSACPSLADKAMLPSSSCPNSRTYPFYRGSSVHFSPALSITPLSSTALAASCVLQIGWLINSHITRMKSLVDSPRILIDVLERSLENSARPL